jgi:uncharacterized protein (DUF1800 family)
VSDDRALIAHLLRRTSFGPLPGQVEALAGGGIAAAIEAVIAARPLPPFGPPAVATEGDLATPWLELMRRPDAGLHEKMTWFWHGHFTSSVSQVDDLVELYNQHLLIRRYALGNFRQLAQAITVDPCMLDYLNGNGSTGDAPNENYAREFLELFTMGRGHYTQSDVTAGARALSGWSVDQRVAVFDPDAAYDGVVSYLGHTGRLRAGDVVDIVCDHPATPRFVAAKIHRYLVGAEASSARLDELAGTFRSAGLEIRPLVEAILRHPSFLQARHNRPRYPVEWVTAATAALGLPTSVDYCSSLGQVPFDPPNVAGWPGGNRWLSGTAALARATLAAQSTPLDDVVAAADPVAEALRRCSLYETSEATRSTLARSAQQIDDPSKRAAVLISLAVVSPEFALA